ncbi:MAG: RNA polymerase sigma-70 factor [Prevotella sp.]|nr:RNA polymerase sigma-70 factor [Prevotella sp.]
MKTERKELFQQRFERYYAAMCRIAYGYLADADDCEDVVQDLFVSVWNHGKDGLPEDQFIAYLKASVRNNCVSFLRRQQRMETVSADARPMLLNGVAEDTRQDRDYGTLLETLLAQMPPKCREVFMMSKVQKMKYKEIATVLDISEKTVENHIGKAIRIIRDYAAAHPTLFLILTLSQLTALGL